jgi:biotin carboxylase
MTLKVKKKLMIVGATWEQVPLVKKAKELGCEVVATAPLPEADGFAFADYAEVVDPRDLQRVLELVRKHGVNAITADECDYSNYAAAFVRNEMGWHNQGMDAVQLTTNKHWMRERCREHHIVQPRFAACRTIEEVREAADLIDFPVIVKPVDNRGAFGVRRVNRAEDLESAFLHALMNAHSREVLVEAFIEGTHLTVDGCIDASGKHFNLGIASKKIMSGDKPIITEVIYPAEISPELSAYVLESNAKVIKALNIKRGITHSEYILDSRGRCFLLETANRGGGVMTSNVIVPAISGVDISELLVREAFNEPFDVKPWKESKAAMLGFLVFPPGKVAKIEGVEAAAAQSGVLHLRMLIKEGDTLVPPQSGAGRHGFGIFLGNSREEVRALCEAANNAIKITYA